MLDKTIPYVSVLMVRNEAACYPRACLPAGFEFRTYKSGYENHWADVILSVDMAESREKALDLFAGEFMDDPAEAERSCLFVFDCDKVAAVASLWYGEHFGKMIRRIHWVATLPQYQGKGLVKALMTRLLDIYYEREYKNGVYLITQTWSYKAVNLYMQYGFEPYLGEKPINWQREGYDEQNVGAWKAIIEKIEEYKA